MKKFFYTLSMLLATSSLMVGVSACSDDDDDPIIINSGGTVGGVTSSSFMGTWKCYNGDMYTFSNGTGTLRTTSSSAGISMTYDFYWAYNPATGTISMDFQALDYGVTYNASITGNTMTLVVNGEYLRMTRI